MTASRQYRTPRTETRADAVRRACARRGVEIIVTEGGAFRLLARGTDILTTDLRHVDVKDLKPHYVTWAGIGDMA